MMKRLFTLIVLLAMGWSGYWAVGYWGVSKGFELWFQDRRADGWVAEYDDLSIAGFPNRFDTTFTNLTLADPDTSVAWSAPFFQLFALSYRPNHVIAVWPHDQSLSTPLEKLSLHTDDMRASLVLRPDTNLTLDRANLTIDGLALQGSADWQLAAQDIDLAVQTQPDTPATYRLALRAQDLTPPVAYQLPSGLQLPRSLETLHADLTATFDRPWDRTAIDDSRPQPTALTLAKAEVTWGDLELNAAGKVTIDAHGNPTGTLTIRAVNWREIIAVARASGHIAPGLLDTVQSALELGSQLSGNANKLDIPLNFKNGTTRLGPVPIAPAPVIRLR
ncbi:DUF2125 domain-containing protein [Shimia sp.]|uniref:DUF2125 domain-containing protein n=1 Tax=Shimia sp. TaxID=1954381 RepID=UPI0032970F2F